MSKRFNNKTCSVYVTEEAKLYPDMTIFLKTHLNNQRITISNSI